MNFKDIPGYVIMWCIIGSMTVAGYAAVTGADTVPPSDYIGIMVFWPLFWVKWFCIGAWMVLSATYGLLA